MDKENKNFTKNEERSFVVKPHMTKVTCFP